MVATVFIVIVAVILICTGVGGILGAMAIGALIGTGLGGVCGGAGTSLTSDAGDIVFKGADISAWQVHKNMVVSGILGTAFAGIGYGISKTFSTFLKNNSWFSKELFRIGKTSNPNYGIITIYLHYQLPALFHTKRHIPLAPIIESVLSRIFATQFNLMTD